MPPKGGRRRRVFMAIFIIGILVFVGLQLVRPWLTNPPVTAELQSPAEVKEILRTSCYNCHSNQTKLPWFDQVVPAYWLVAADVKHARERVNFSEIGVQAAAKQKGILFEAVNQIQLGAMPLPSYRFVHPEAAVTPEKLAVLRAYLESLAPPTPVNATSVADAQYEKWIAFPNEAPAQAQPAPNGIAFLPDYKDWKAISSTDRFDNGTMREILGNDIAVRAIVDHHINPWPDGTAFAKVAWYQQPDANGLISTGAFLQVEFMIRDSTKYASTKGWGWARWLGTDLKPYGKSAAFTNECVNCHTPVRQNDYVYTMPIGDRE